jgi:hypothetical protein
MTFYSIRNFVLIIVSSLMMISCKKEKTVQTVNETPVEGTILKSGNFTSNAHPTSGTVKLVKINNDSFRLVFENFSTDNGPDLKVWISSSTNPTSYITIGDLTAINGNFSYEADPDYNYTINNKVLIWCEDFSVLFGHATLE